MFQCVDYSHLIVLVSGYWHLFSCPHVLHVLSRINKRDTSCGCVCGKIRARGSFLVEFFFGDIQTPNHPRQVYQNLVCSAQFHAIFTVLAQTPRGAPLPYRSQDDRS